MKSHSRKQELKQKLEAEFSVRMRKPVLGQTTIFPAELTKPLYDYIYNYELTEKEQASISPYEMQTLLLEIALMDSESLKEMRKLNPNLSKLELITHRIVNILRSDTKYWIGKSDPNIENAISEYCAYIDDIRGSKSTITPYKDANESENMVSKVGFDVPNYGKNIPILSEIHELPSSNTAPQKINLAFSGGILIDLFQYLRTFMKPQSEISDYNIQKLISILVSKIPSSALCKSKKYADINTEKLRLRSYEIKYENDGFLLKSVAELWKEQILIEFDFFLGMTVFLQILSKKI